MAADTRDRILAAATRLYAAPEAGGPALRAIAREGGVNSALIHYHFQSKAGLLQSLLDRYYEALGQRLSGELQAEGDMRERMHRLVDGYLDFLRENRNFGRIVQREASGGDPRLERLAPDQLHREEAGPLVLFHRVHLHDARVVERGE